ncbi:hypothetical protein [Streptomyces olivaceiscleroticus]|uniref:Uncharacterized protein n=1 Tax=Streptomyces olivaceiscleroticus TaxID=68245 RepID=A0ABN0ZLX7_9ACTN
MSVYASIRGWLECDEEQYMAAGRVIAENYHDPYSNGWGFPSAHFNWTWCIFYGGDLQEGDVDWLFRQVADIAALPETEDGDRVQGLFMVTHETKGMFEWQVSNGIITVIPGDKRHDYLSS